MERIADQPFQILLGLVQGHKLDPWDVDIEKLAGLFMQRVGKMRELDLRVSGRTLLSASVLLRMKSDYALDGRGKEGTDEELEELLDISLPELGQITIVQRSPHKITLVELMGALREALRDVPAPRPPRRRGLERVVRTLSEYHINVEKYIDELYQRITDLTAAGHSVSLSELAAERTKIAVARTLLLILFLSAQGRVTLRQDEPFGEVFVSLSRG